MKASGGLLEAGTAPGEAPGIRCYGASDNWKALLKAGVLLDLAGLQPSSKGARIRFSGGKRTVIDGPFTETKELIGGYWIIRVNSREEAMEWAMRYFRLPREPGMGNRGPASFFEDGRLQSQRGGRSRRANPGKKLEKSR